MRASEGCPRIQPQKPGIGVAARAGSSLAPLAFGAQPPDGRGPFPCHTRSPPPPLHEALCSLRAEAKLHFFAEILAEIAAFPCSQL